MELKAKTQVCRFAVLTAELVSVKWVHCSSVSWKEESLVNESLGSITEVAKRAFVPDLGARFAGIDFLSTLKSYESGPEATSSLTLTK
jgi:hypothetical protein